jgi:acetylornithine deacetylase/succinyl-diaminopimelate desuccinylase-like protein
MSYRDFLSIPNVSKDAALLQKNAEYISRWMNTMGIQTELLSGYSAEAVPAVWGRVDVPGAKETLAFYAHYDGQPVNAKQWANGLEPFVPVFLDAPIERGGKILSIKSDPAEISPQWRLSGRGSADDKGGIFCILRAFEALKESGVPLKHNLLFFFEGEEESGSTHLSEIFEKNRSKLQADMWIIADGPRHVSGRKVVQFGVRGDVNMHLTVFGAKRPLHSGNYGNWAPNPARMLVELLASMKDGEGRVTIPGFYDDVTPLSASETIALKAIPDIEPDLKKELGILETEGNGRTFAELLHLPTLNINGIQSANVGSMAANIIPSRADAVIDLRLVLGNDVNRQVGKVEEFIRSKGYHIIDHEPTDEERKTYPRIIRIVREKGYNAQRTPMDLPIAQRVLRTVQKSTSQGVVALPSAGGSLPLIVFEEVLKARVITVPVVNYDNNQHAENENVLIGYLWEGVETMGMLMVME